MKSFRHITLPFALLAAGLCSGLAGLAQAPAPTGDLTVLVSGLKSTQGQLVVSVYRQGDDLFGPPFLQQRVRLAEPARSLIFPGLPYASYAVLAFHDENSNGTLDHNWLHLPKEPLGYSNHWNFGLLTGRPTFEKTKFDFTRENFTAMITVK